VLSLIKPQRGILTRMLFGIRAGGGDNLSTMKYTSPRMQAEHKAVKSSPAEDRSLRAKNERTEISLTETIEAILLMAD